MGDTSSGKGKLNSWKEIARYLDRHVSTVQRWEKEGGFPVHHLVYKKRGSVFAYCSEIDAWLETRSITSNRQTQAAESLPIRFPRKVFVGITAAALAFVVALLIWTGSLDTERFNSHDHHQVLIADFENLTGEATFDEPLRFALLQEIGRLEFVTVFPRRQIEETLLLMRKPVATAIDLSLGREISLREGNVSAVLSGSLTKLGSSYFLTTALIDPVQNRQVASLSQGINEPEDVFRVLSSWVRGALQEHLPTLRNSERRLAQVTTSDLHALRLYTQADALIVSGSRGPARELLEQAIAIDPMFASAEILLAYCLQRQNRRNRGNEDFMSHAESAMQLSGGVRDRERYFIQATYYNMKGEDEKSIRAHQTLVSLYHSQMGAKNRPVGLGTNAPRLSEVSAGARQDLIYQVQYAESQPSQFYGNFVAGLLLVKAFGNTTLSQTYISRARNLIGPRVIEAAPGEVAWVKLFPAFQAVLDGDPQQALLHSRRLVATPLFTTSVFGGVERKFGGGALGSIYLNLGQLKEAREWFEDKVRTPQLRRYFLAWSSYIADDQRMTLKYLRQSLASQENDLAATSKHMALLLLAKLGSLAEVEEIVSYGRPGSILDHEIRGIFNVRWGNTSTGIELLEKVLPKVRDSYFLAVEVLVDAYLKEGDLSRAIDLLEEASQKKSFLLDQTVTTGPIWLKTQLLLAGLYSHTDEEEKVRKIEDQLRQQLAYADADHPILQVLGSFSISD